MSAGERLPRNALGPVDDQDGERRPEVIGDDGHASTGGGAGVLEAAQLCPCCGSAMVERRNRETGEPFLGCSGYPGCRGTRQVVGARSGPPSDVRRSRRPRLSHGGRRTGWSDDVELLVARIVGRDLKPWEGCLIQLAAILLVGLFFYWLYASGTILVLIKPIADWMASQMHVGPVPSG